jgi:hypothetical protein
MCARFLQQFAMVLQGCAMFLQGFAMKMQCFAMADMGKMLVCSGFRLFRTFLREVLLKRPRLNNFGFRLHEGVPEKLKAATGKGLAFL